MKEQMHISIDNNVVCGITGLNYKFQKYLEKNPDCSVDDVTLEKLYPDKRPDENHKKTLSNLLVVLKLSLKKIIRIVILPTVLDEIFDGRINLRDNKPNKFFLDNCVEHVIFTERQKMLIDELTKKLLEPKFYNGKKQAPFDGNHNKNHDHDARIFAESIFRGTSLMTFDNDFKNKKLIYEVVEKFEQKYPEEAKGISQFGILTPKKHPPKDYSK